MTDRSEHALVRGLGLYGAISVVAGTMIGTAIFVVPSMMLAHVRRPLLMLAVWAFAGVLSLFGALGYAELGAAIPQAGGEYAYLIRAFGPRMGFLYGWTQFVVAKAASIAAIATGFLLYLAYFFPGLTATAVRAAIPVAGHRFDLRLTGLQLGSTLLILLMSGLNILGVRRSGAVQTLFTAAKLAVLAVLIGLGLGLGHGSFQHLRQAAGVSPSAGLAGGFVLATLSALWAYDGWNNLSMVAAEVERPKRNIPRALICGTLLVLAVYLLVNLAYLYALAPGQIVATTTVAAAAARRFLGAAGGTFVAVGVLISTFATLNGSILSGSRIPYAQACDGLFPGVLARIHVRYRTPAVAIAAQAVVAGAFALSGVYEALYTKALYSEWIFYALVTAGIFVLRRREPGLERPYRTWGYPIVPAIFLTLAALLLANTFFERRADALWSVALVLSGVPAYALWRRWRHAQPEPELPQGRGRPPSTLPAEGVDRS